MSDDDLPPVPELDARRCPCGSVLVGPGLVECDCGRSMWIPPRDERTREHTREYYGRPIVQPAIEALRAEQHLRQTHHATLIRQIKCQLDGGHDRVVEKRLWPIWNPWVVRCEACDEVLYP